MKSQAYINHGVMPPLTLPIDVNEALRYLAEALGHVVYECWTWTRLKQRYPALSQAREDKPVVFRLLIDAPEVIEFWERGRIRILPESEAPSTNVVLQRLLHTHRRRFKPARDQFNAENSGNVAARPLSDLLFANTSPHLSQWLARSGRFVNQNADTNTLAVTDDVQPSHYFCATGRTVPATRSVPM